MGQVLNRLTKPNYLWANGHVERMNRTFKEAIDGVCRACASQSEKQRS